MYIYIHKCNYTYKEHPRPLLLPLLPACPALMACTQVVRVGMLSCLSHVWLFAAYWLWPTRLRCPWNFLRQEHWSGLPCPPPGDLPDPGIKPGSPTSPALQVDSPTEPPRMPELRSQCTGLDREHLLSPSQPSLPPPIYPQASISSCLWTSSPQP